MFANRIWAFSYGKSRDVSTRLFVTNALSAGHLNGLNASMSFRIGFLHQKFAQADLMSIRPFFSRLPIDPFEHIPTNGNRRRRFTEYKLSLLKDGSRLLTRRAHEPFVQGGIARDFEPIEPALDDVLSFRSLLFAFYRHSQALGLPEFAKPDITIGVHQIRITACRNRAGVVAPEGFHQDDFLYVGIFCVERGNISGGVTRLKDFKTGEWTADLMLKPGSLLTFDDCSSEHYTTPITTRTNGFRDVFVLTVK
jgi:hypothetical protein